MNASLYLKRYAYPKSWIVDKPSDNLGLVVVIPAFKEPDITTSLASLGNCSLPGCDVEVIIVINGPENAPASVVKQNKICLNHCLDWIKTIENDRIKFHVIWADQLPAKEHGVGLARKIGMDEAILRLDIVDNIDNGIIVCFDADSTCDPDYLLKVYEHFDRNPLSSGASIYFEHPIDEVEDEKVRLGIIQYELHLRYYIHAQQYAGVPYAFQTVGSSMAVRADAYQKQGGMNKRKAGEDFYFLHKIISLGGYGEIRNTTVYPSCRKSDRVPFGTGRAISEWLESDSRSLSTYNPESLKELKTLFSNLKKIYKTTHVARFPESLKSFLEMEDFEKSIVDIRTRTSSFASFEKRFYSWFNAFKVMKYLHYSRDHFHANLPVEVASKWLLNKFYGIDAPEDAYTQLKLFREIDRGLLNQIRQ